MGTSEMPSPACGLTAVGMLTLTLTLTLPSVLCLLVENPWRRPVLLVAGSI